MKALFDISDLYLWTFTMVCYLYNVLKRLMSNLLRQPQSERSYLRLYKKDKLLFKDSVIIFTMACLFVILGLLYLCSIATNAYYITQIFSAKGKLTAVKLSRILPSVLILSLSVLSIPCDIMKIGDMFGNTTIIKLTDSYEVFQLSTILGLNLLTVVTKLRVYKFTSVSLGLVTQRSIILSMVCILLVSLTLSSSCFVINPAPINNDLNMTSHTIISLWMELVFYHICEILPTIVVCCIIFVQAFSYYASSPLASKSRKRSPPRKQFTSVKRFFFNFLFVFTCSWEPIAALKIMSIHNADNLVFYSKLSTCFKLVFFAINPFTDGIVNYKLARRFHLYILKICSGKFKSDNELNRTNRLDLETIQSCDGAVENSQKHEQRETPESLKSGTNPGKNKSINNLHKRRMFKRKMNPAITTISVDTEFDDKTKPSVTNCYQSQSEHSLSTEKNVTPSSIGSSISSIEHLSPSSNFFPTINMVSLTPEHIPFKRKDISENFEAKHSQFLQLQRFSSPKFETENMRGSSPVLVTASKHLESPVTPDSPLQRTKRANTLFQFPVRKYSSCMIPKLTLDVLSKLRKDEYKVLVKSDSCEQ